MVRAPNIAMLLTKDKGVDKFIEKLKSKGVGRCSTYSDIGSLLVGISQNKVDFVVISANYQHKNVCRFPLIIQSSMGCGALLGGESNDYRVTKIIRKAKCEYKITGKMTPNNVWAKIVSYFKNKEKKEEKQRGKISATGNQSTESIKVSGSVNQKNINISSEGNANSQNINLGRSTNISDILKQLNSNEPSNEENLSMEAKEKNTSSDTANRSMKNNLNPNGSKENQKDEPNKVKNSKDGMFENKDKSPTLKTKLMKGKALKTELAKTSKKRGAKIDQKESDPLVSTGASESLNSKSPDNFTDMDSRNNKEQAQRGDQSEFDKKKKMNSDKDTDESKIEASSLAKAKSSQQSNQSSKKNNNLDQEQRNSSMSPSEETPPVQRGSHLKKENDENLSRKKMERAGKNGNNQKDQDQSKPNKGESSTNRKNINKIKKSDERNRQKEKFGFVEKLCVDFLKNKKIEVNKSKIVNENPTYKVIILRSGQEKGYLLFSSNSNVEEKLFTDLYDSIDRAIPDSLYSGRIDITLDFKQDKGWEEECLQFRLVGESSDDQSTEILFYKIKKPLPSYQEKEGYLELNLMLIPPETTIPFNGYAYFPLNERHVRIVKKDRKISKDQIKKYLKNPLCEKILVPNSEIRQLIQFYVTHRLNWSYLQLEKNRAA